MGYLDKLKEMAREKIEEKREERKLYREEFKKAKKEKLKEKAREDAEKKVFGRSDDKKERGGLDKVADNLSQIGQPPGFQEKRSDKKRDRDDRDPLHLF